eukprot:11203566-Lingulodinium_polyedra.AAC.1
MALVRRWFGIGVALALVWRWQGIGCGGWFRGLFGPRPSRARSKTPREACQRHASARQAFCQCQTGAAPAPR